MNNGVKAALVVVGTVVGAWAGLCAVVAFTALRDPYRHYKTRTVGEGPLVPRWYETNMGTCPCAECKNL